MLDGEPADGPSDSALIVLNNQRAVVVADQTIHSKRPLEGVRCGEAAEAERIVARIATPQEGDVISPDGTQTVFTTTPP